MTIIKLVLWLPSLAQADQILTEVDWYVKDTPSMARFFVTTRTQPNDQKSHRFSFVFSSDSESVAGRVSASNQIFEEMHRIDLPEIACFWTKFKEGFSFSTTKYLMCFSEDETRLSLTRLEHHETTPEFMPRPGIFSNNQLIYMKSFK